ncbi:eCIS core domain-containing protein [Streptomyces parvus]
MTRLLEEERERQEESARPSGTEAAPDVQRSAVQNVLRAPGRPLDAALKDDMESRFDADFSDVRLHTGAAARDSAAEIGARAYTSGSHIVIGDGGGDQHTLAH